MQTIRVEAKPEQLPSVNAFLEAALEKCDCSMKAQMQLQLAAEEVFINIASYAYQNQTGEVEISLSIEGAPPQAALCFTDHGQPFNPLEKQDADTDMPADQREIGGLGILLVKRTMNSATYAYKDGKNILTLYKALT